MKAWKHSSIDFVLKESYFTDTHKLMIQAQQNFGLSF